MGTPSLNESKKKKNKGDKRVPTLVRVFMIIGKLHVVGIFGSNLPNYRLSHINILIKYESVIRIRVKKMILNR